MTVERVDLLVVGGGPVGLAAAVAAVESGLRPLVVDRSRRAALRSYALALHPASLELLDAWGVFDELLPLARRIDGTTVYRDGAEVGEFDFGRLDADRPFVLALGQPWLEGALEQRLARAGAPVLWEHQLISLEQHADEVVAIIAEVGELGANVAAGDEDAAASASTVRARYVLGADGGQSTLRQVLDVDSVRADEVAGYRLIEYETDSPPEPRQRLVLDGRRLHAMWPLAAQSRRWSLHLDESETPASPEAAIESMRPHAPWVDRPTEVLWDTTVGFERRLCSSLGHGRAWLAGDAARVCRPLGVHSMNAGIAEVARFVEAIRADGDAADRLAIWSDAVRAAWRGVLEPESRLTFDDDAPAWAREHAARLVDALPATGENLVALLAQHGIRFRSI